METYEICGKEYEIEDYVRVFDDTNGKIVGGIPIVNIPMMSDYNWHLLSLQGRLKHPEWYVELENVEEVKQKVKQTLLELTTPELYSQYCDKYSDCYDYIYEKAEAIAV